MDEQPLINKLGIDTVVWTAGLAGLTLVDPYITQSFTICPFHNLGLPFCPGCGLGRSIAFLYHGDLVESFQAHPLGIIVFAFLVYRIAKAVLQFIHHLKRRPKWQMLWS
jgi:hypothetical protein